MATRSGHRSQPPGRVLRGSSDPPVLHGFVLAVAWRTGRQRPHAGNLDLRILVFWKTKKELLLEVLNEIKI